MMSVSTNRINEMGYLKKRNVSFIIIIVSIIIVSKSYS